MESPIKKILCSLVFFLRVVSQIQAVGIQNNEEKNGMNLEENSDLNPHLNESSEQGFCGEFDRGAYPSKKESLDENEIAFDDPNLNIHLIPGVYQQIAGGDHFLIDNYFHDEAYEMTLTRQPEQIPPSFLQFLVSEEGLIWAWGFHEQIKEYLPFVYNLQAFGSYLLQILDSETAINKAGTFGLLAAWIGLPGAPIIRTSALLFRLYAAYRVCQAANNLRSGALL